jgi:hydrogenase nickel incorporation protein HypA/HybF
MHELSLAQSIVEAVESRAEECGADAVRSVRLRIGEASGVLVEALQYSFEMLASLSPLLAGAQLVIERVPHRAWCASCACAFAVEHFIARCPTCGAWSTQILSGTELQIVDMEIAGHSAEPGENGEPGGSPG